MIVGVISGQPIEEHCLVGVGRAWIQFLRHFLQQLDKFLATKFLFFCLDSALYVPMFLVEIFAADFLV